MGGAALSFFAMLQGVLRVGAFGSTCIQYHQVQGYLVDSPRADRAGYAGVHSEMWGRRNTRRGMLVMICAFAHKIRTERIYLNVETV